MLFVFILHVPGLFLFSLMLFVECASPNGPNNLNDVNFINLALVKELQVKKEVTTAPDVPVSLNLQRVIIHYTF